MLLYIFINPQCQSAVKGRLPEIRSVSIRISLRRNTVNLEDYRKLRKFSYMAHKRGGKKYIEKLKNWRGLEHSLSLSPKHSKNRITRMEKNLRHWVMEAVAELGHEGNLFVAREPFSGPSPFRTTSLSAHIPTRRVTSEEKVRPDKWACGARAHLPSCSGFLV